MLRLANGRGRSERLEYGLVPATALLLGERNVRPWIEYEGWDQLLRGTIIVSA